MTKPERGKRWLEMDAVTQGIIDKWKPRFAAQEMNDELFEELHLECEENDICIYRVLWFVEECGRA